MVSNKCVFHVFAVLKQFDEHQDHDLDLYVALKLAQKADKVLEPPRFTQMSNKPQQTY